MAVGPDRGKASRLMKGSLFAYKCKRQCGRYTANKGKVCTKCLNAPLGIDCQRPIFKE